LAIDSSGADRMYIEFLLRLTLMPCLQRAGG
jgi:hypothetical protein